MLSTIRAVILEAPELDAYGQMALDDAVFSRAEPDAVALRLYRWPGGIAEPGPSPVPKGVTFGYFQAYEEVMREIHDRGLSVTFPVARRLTGGGIVYHDGDITFSVVFPWSRLIAASWIYEDVHRAIRLGLKTFGIPSRLWSPPRAGSTSFRAAPGAYFRHAPHTDNGGGKDNPVRLPPPPDQDGRGEPRSDLPPISCFTDPSPMDLVHEDGAKFLGGALRRRNGVGLYQGSLRPEGFRAPRAQLARAVTDGIALQWKTFFSPQEADAGLLREADRLRRRRYDTDEWNKRR